MKKITSLFTLLTAVTIMLAPDAAQSGSMTDVRLADLKQLRKAYYFNQTETIDSQFHGSKWKWSDFDYIEQLVESPIWVQGTRIEGETEDDLKNETRAGSINSLEEFLTVVFYSPLHYKGQIKIIKKELPEGKTGALRLAAMWFFKIAEYPENREKYMNAVNLVLKMAKEKHGVSVKLSDARKFYEEAIKEKIYATPLGEPLTVEEQKKVKELLLAYMIEPGKKTQRAFTDYKDYLNSYDVKKGVAMITFVKRISRWVNAELA